MGGRGGDVPHLRFSLVIGTVAVLAASCSPASDRLRSVPSADAMCVPDTFIGSMTVTCPQRVPAEAAPDR